MSPFCPHVLQLASTLLMLCTSDVYTLINYVGFVNYLFYGVTVAGLIVLRVQQPSLQRPIKVTEDKSSLLPHCPSILQSRSLVHVGENPGSSSRLAWCGR